MDYSFYTNEELEELAIEGDNKAAAELQRRYEGEDISESFDDELYEDNSASDDQELTAAFSTDQDEADYSVSEYEQSEVAEEISEISNNYSEPIGSESDYMSSTEEYYYDNDSEEDSWRKKLSASFDCPSSLSGNQEIDSIRNLPLLKLKNLADDGDPIAAYILGERMLDNPGTSEEGTGLKLIMMAINTLNDMFARGTVDKALLLEVTTSCADKLVSLCEEHLNSNTYNQSADSIIIDNCYYDRFEVLGGCAYQLCSNLYELDDTNASKLSACYEKGIGREKDFGKATQLKEKAAVNGFFIDKVSIFARKAVKEKYITGGADLDADYWNDWSLESTLWAQRALASIDANEHPKLTARLRMWLAQNNQTDESSNHLDYQSCKEQYLAEDTASLSDDELFFLYLFAETDGEKTSFANQIQGEYFPEILRYKSLLSERAEIIKKRAIQEKEAKKVKVKKTIQDNRGIIIFFAVFILFIACCVLFPNVIEGVGNFFVNLIEVIVVIALCIICSGAA